MKNLQVPSLTLCSLFVFTLLSGCNEGSDAPEEKLVKASGTVKVDDQPAAGVRIRLTPINETKSVGGSWGVTKDDGTFTLTHWTNAEGIAPGSYLITFSRLVKPDGSPLGEKDSPAMVQAKETIAADWSNAEPDQMVAMTRRVDIPEGGKTDIDFSITTSGE